MTLGNNIRYLRRKRGWSQDHLAELLHYKNYTSIQKWESGVAEPRFKTVQELADIFQVGIDELTSLDLERGETFATNEQTTGHEILFKEASTATEEELLLTAQYLRFLKQTKKE